MHLRGKADASQSQAAAGPHSPTRSSLVSISYFLVFLFLFVVVVRLLGGVYKLRIVFPCPPKLHIEGALNRVWGMLGGREMAISMWVELAIILEVNLSV